MADIKLFRIEAEHARELPSQSVAIERSLQQLLEKHLQDFLGVRFLASEYSTGRNHGGRIDTLGLDDDCCPVIIEYKRTSDENVITQGLFYLDWLMDHKAEFSSLVFRQFGQEAMDEIDWDAPRLLCIAGDFNRYDEHAVQQIQRNINLLRYRRYGDDLLLLELVNAGRSGSVTTSNSSTKVIVSPGPKADGSREKTEYTGFIDLLAICSPQLTDLWHSIDDYLRALGDEVQVLERKYYVAYRRLKNFAAVEVHPRAGFHVVFVKVDPSEVQLESGFTRDVSNIGHWESRDSHSQSCRSGTRESAYHAKLSIELGLSVLPHGLIENRLVIVRFLLPQQGTVV